MKEEKITNKKTAEYLEQIFSGELLIHNPTRFNLIGFGEVTATSMVNNHYTFDGRFPYFTFEVPLNEEEIGHGEFYKKDGEYFVKYDRKGEIK